MLGCTPPGDLKLRAKSSFRSRLCFSSLGIIDTLPAQNCAGAIVRWLCVERLPRKVRKKAGQFPQGSGNLREVARGRDARRVGGVSIAVFLGQILHLAEPVFCI